MRLLIAAAAVSVAGTALGQPRLTEQEVTAAASRIDAALERVLALQSDRTINSGAPETPPVKPIGDVAFLRRICISLAGRLPTEQEVRAFTADPTPAKRARAIDRLLQEPRSGDWRFQRMAEPLRVTDEVLGVSQADYVQWLRRALAEDTPYDRLMARLVGARGTLAEDPAAGFLLRDSGHVEVTTAELARAFLGQDIHCAGCHDHPYSDHTQRHFYEFAACFNFVRPRSHSQAPTQRRTLLPGTRPLSRKAIPATPPQENAAFFQSLELANEATPMKFPSFYYYRDVNPGDEVIPAYLPLVQFAVSDPRSAFLARPSGAKLRDQLVLWMTSRENVSFTSVAAERIWDWMFGVPGRLIAERQEAGFSDPDPPRLIWKGKGCGQAMAFGYGAWLENRKEFVADLRREFEYCDCRIGEFQRVLANTRAYQQEAIPADPPGLNRLLPAPVVRRLPAEVIWDALVSWLPPQGRSELRRASIDLPQVPPADHPLRIMGRGSRQWADESRIVISHHLARLMIGSPTVEQITAADSALLVAASNSPDHQGQVEHLFLDILGRYPQEKERAAASRHLSGNPKKGAADVAWALLNTSEFLFQQ